MTVISIAAISLAVLIMILLYLCSFHRKLQEPAQIGYSIDYVHKIFDDSYVHVIDIQLPQVNWDYMVQHATKEQYVISLVILYIAFRRVKKYRRRRGRR